jgi:hypothetical protein
LVGGTEACTTATARHQLVGAGELDVARTSAAAAAEERVPAPVGTSGAATPRPAPSTVTDVPAASERVPVTLALSPPVRAPVAPKRSKDSEVTPVGTTQLCPTPGVEKVTVQVFTAPP